MIRAKFDGKPCPACGERTRAGQKIVKPHDATKWQHNTCPPAARLAVATAELAAMTDAVLAERARPASARHRGATNRVSSRMMDLQREVATLTAKIEGDAP